MIYLFDVDGTLTDPRQKIDPDFRLFFKEFCLINDVYLVTGSDLPKTYEQLDKDIIELYVEGVFSDMGNILTCKNKTIYKNAFLPPVNLIVELEHILEKYELLKTGNHIEYRSGMINFSLIGRNATQEQREAYTNDKRSQEIRKHVVSYLKDLFEPQGLDFALGGQISIDIQPKGKDKQQAVKWLTEKYGNIRMSFFGDKTFKGGNDHTISLAVENIGGLVYQVENWKETETLLKQLLN